MWATIRVRLTLSHLLVIVIAMGLSGLLLLSFLEGYFTQAAEESLLAQAQITVQALLPGVTPVEPFAEETGLPPASNMLQQRQSSNLSVETQNWDQSDLPSIYESDRTFSNWSRVGPTDASVQLSADLSTHIRILDESGAVVMDSWGEGVGTELGSNRLVVQALAGRVASEIDADRVISLVYPAVSETELVGVILLSQPLDDVTAVLRDLRNRWLLATGIALLFSGALGLVLSGAVARPVRRLIEAAGAVAEGEFDRQVPVRSRDELGRLSQVFNDMTRRLRAARQMQTDFVANVSHELRTPLTAVKGTVETLRDGAVDDPAVRDRFLATVESETDRLIRLVNDLLLLSRADSEALNLQLGEVDLAELIPLTVEKLLPAAERHGVEIKVRVDAGCPAVWVDRDRIEQVLFNLLDNAVKYSQPENIIIAGAQRDPVGTWVVVEVADQGVGIPASELPFVGRRFYRADKARSRTRGGSGLGLAIARALVEAHGGELWLESQESEGTVASFSLPTGSRAPHLT